MLLSTASPHLGEESRLYDPEMFRWCNKLYAFRILIPNLKTINLTFGGLSPILYVK